MSPNEPSSFRLIVSVCLAGLCSGVVLSAIYSGTKERIAANRAEYLKAAIFRVLPGTEHFQSFLIEGENLVPYEGPEGSIPSGEAIFQGLDANGTPTGFAIPTQGPGFMDTIRIIYGYKPEEQIIVGMQVLEDKETPGLGDKIKKDPAFLANFDALAVKPELVPNKKPPKTKPNQVDTISGATISSKAVINMLNAEVKHLDPIFAKSLDQADQEHEGE